MNLYELKAQAKMDNYVDVETGEIDLEAFAQAEMDFKDKIQAVCYVIKQKQTDATQLKEEAKRLNERAKMAEREEEKLRDYLLGAIDAEKGYKDDKFTLSVRTIDDYNYDESLIPKDYFKVKTTETLDKNKVKADVKAGKAVAGVTVSKKQSLQMR